MERKNMAQKWLTQAQGSAQAWQFCWALLGPDKVRYGGVLYNFTHPISAVKQIYKYHIN